VVPLFGDVVIGPFNYVQKTANYDPQHWRQCLTAGSSQQATILPRMSEYRQQHVELICELMLLSEQRHKLVQVTVAAVVLDHYLCRRFASGEGIVSLGVTQCVCVCPQSRDCTPH